MTIKTDIKVALPEAIESGLEQFTQKISDTLKEDLVSIVLYGSIVKGEHQRTPNTLKDWRDHLVANKVVDVFKGNGSMSLILRSPYDSLVTCEQDDWAAIRIKTDPKVKRVLDKLASHDNMSLLPLIVELLAKVNKLEKAMVG